MSALKVANKQHAFGASERRNGKHNLLYAHAPIGPEGLWFSPKNCFPVSHYAKIKCFPAYKTIINQAFREELSRD